jgi:dipeptidyl aminopeptidase/acylaminoacyl peptidase
MHIALIAALLAARPFTPEELLRTRRPEDVQVSPDGRWASVTVRQKNLDENRDAKDVWLISLATGEGKQFTRNGRSEHARWAPDGRALLISRESQLWLYPLDGGDPRQITTLSTGADNGVFSADGRLIAFTSDVYPDCRGGGAGSAGDGRSLQGGALEDACDKRHTEEHEKGPKARIINHLFARHWTEWKDGKRTHIFIQAVDGGAAKDVTPYDSDWPSWSLGGGDDFQFTPENDLVVHSKPAEREAWSTNGDLWLVGENGIKKNLTEINEGDDAQPRLSPDGKYLAWTSQARDGYESDQWRLKIRDRRTGAEHLITLGSDDVGTIVWRRDSNGLVVSSTQKAHMVLESVKLDGTHEIIVKDASDDFALTPDGTPVFVNAGITHPPEVFKGATPTRLSHFNDDQYKGLDLGTIQDLWLDGVHSWIVRPAGNQRHPLLVLIHGGPEGSWEDGWSMRWNLAAFAARGYVVVATDFHGSTGYGQKFKESIVGDWGGQPFQDIMKATDAAERLPFVEPGHTCAAGASYGGYMIDWIAGHTDRFRCLVSHDGVFDLVSMYGSTEELWFPEWEFHGPPWQNPELYHRLSPSTYVANFKTPTLVVQGELDFRVPVEQGLGMFTALQRRGVESRLLYFPDEGHWVLKPRNSQLWYHTVLDWIDAHARPRTASAK